jgi:hypothetical protein
MESINLSQDEINELKSIQDQTNQLIVSFGQIELGIQTLEIQKNELKSKLIELKIKEDQLGQTLQSKYGNGSINIETGEFIKAG